MRDDGDQDITGIVARKVNLGASSNGVGIRFDTSGNSGCFSESVDANPQIAQDRACFLWMDVWNGAWLGGDLLVINNISIEWTLAAESYTRTEVSPVSANTRWGKARSVDSIACKPRVHRV